MEYIKILILSFERGLLINGNRTNKMQFFLGTSITPTPLQLGYTE